MPTPGLGSFFHQRANFNFHVATEAKTRSDSEGRYNPFATLPYELLEIVNVAGLTRRHHGPIGARGPLLTMSGRNELFSVSAGILNNITEDNQDPLSIFSKVRARNKIHSCA